MSINVSAHIKGRKAKKKSLHFANKSLEKGIGSYQFNSLEITVIA